MAGESFLPEDPYQYGHSHHHGHETPDAYETDRENIGYLEVDSVDGKYFYRLGIIDFLTEYNKFKYIENRTKSKFYNVDKTQVSAIDERSYQKRFMEFMEENL